jgi:Na+-translocating ferredoxin:NAD+ oxidoreductase RnfG subunit
VLRQSATLMLVMLAAIAIEAGIKSWTKIAIKAVNTEVRRTAFINIIPPFLFFSSSV